MVTALTVLTDLKEVIHLRAVTARRLDLNLVHLLGARSSVAVTRALQSLDHIRLDPGLKLEVVRRSVFLRSD